MPGVVFAPRKPTWMDYAAPLIQQYLMGAIDRTNKANQYKRDQLAAQEAQKRAQEQALWKEEQIERVLGGGNAAQPGDVQIPGMMNRGGGSVNSGGGGLDLRKPSDAFTKLALSMGYMPDEGIKQIQHMLSNLNAPYAQQEIDLGDRKGISLLNPSTGKQTLQMLKVGLSPGVKDTNDAKRLGDRLQLQGTNAVAGSTVNAAKIRAEAEEKAKRIDALVKMIEAMNPQKQSGNLIDFSSLYANRNGLSQTPQANPYAKALAEKLGSELGFDLTQPETGQPSVPGLATPGTGQMPKQFEWWMSDEEYQTMKAKGFTDEIIAEAIRRAEAASQNAGAGLSPLNWESINKGYSY